MQVCDHFRVQITQPSTHFSHPTLADVRLGVVVYEDVSLQPDPLAEDLLAVRADVAAPLPLPVVLQVRLERGFRHLPLALRAGHLGGEVEGGSLGGKETKQVKFEKMLWDTIS